MDHLAGAFCRFLRVAGAAAALTLFAHIQPAAAQTVTCAGGHTATTATTITYLPGGTCTIADSQTGSNVIGSISMIFFVGSNNVAGFLGTGSSSIPSAHDGCSIAEFSATPGTNCISNRTNPATETATISTKVSDGTRYTMTASYTVAGGGTSFTVNSASVTVTPASSGSGQRATPSSTAKALTAAVSGTQVRFTTQNIQRHVDVLTGGGVAAAISAPPIPSPGPSGGGAAVPGAPAQFTLVREPGNGFDFGSRRNTWGGAGGNLDRLLAGAADGPAPAWRSDDVQSGRRDRSFHDFRALATAVLPSLSYDSARGDTLRGSFDRLVANVGSNFSGGLAGGRYDDRLNQVQDTVPGQLPRQPRDVARGPRDIHTWLYTSYSSVENQRNRTGDDQRFGGDMISVTGGIDKWLDKEWLAGVAVSYSNVFLQTTFNDGDYLENAVTLSPYLVYKPNDWLAVNASLGYTYSAIDQNQDRASNLTNAETRADTFYGALNAKATKRFETLPLTLAASAGYTKSRRGVDGFFDTAGTFTAQQFSNSSLLRAGVEASYAVTVAGQHFEPFVMADILREFQDTTNGDPVAGEVGGGIKWADPGLGLNASLEATTVVGRSDYRQYNIRAIVVKGIESETLAGRLTPNLSLGMVSGATVAGVGLGYKHDRSSFSAGLSVEMRQAQTLSIIDDAIAATDTTRREGVIMLRAQTGF